MKVKFLIVLILISVGVKGAQIPEDLILEQVAVAEFPVGFISAKDGSGRMFIVEKSGVVKILKNGVVLETPFLDISDQVATVNEQGLLGLAFAPDYLSSGYFYVYFSYDEYGTTVSQKPMRLARFEVSDNADLADVNSMFVITDLPQLYSYHNGGQIAFGMDDYLYIGTGDDGVFSAPQSVANAKGKMLRIDVSNDLIYKNEFDGDVGCGYPQNYFIPDDNPFINDFEACHAVYLVGLRNPWRWSFDRLTGKLFIGDVGAAREEEVNEVFIPNDAGANLGWPCIEGSYVHNQKCADEIDNLVNPFFTYERISGQSQAVIGGYVYRGAEIPELNGVYIFNDMSRSEFYFSGYTNGAWQTTLWDEQFDSIVSYGEDEDGELYFLSFDGPIYKLTQK